mgnify:CR=1 FL=1
MSGETTACTRASTKYGVDWSLSPSDGAKNEWATGSVQIILLQEIRDALTRLNTLLHCDNFARIPRTLRTISRNTARRRPRRRPRRNTKGTR